MEKIHNITKNPKIYKFPISFSKLLFYTKMYAKHDKAYINVCIYLYVIDVW